MAKELRGLGVTLGPRVGEHWEGCSIPGGEGNRDMLGLWGPVMFGAEGEIARRPILDRLIRSIRGEPEPEVIKRKPARRVR
jgi:hypothetical protein